jgi:membrane-anchored glycerophosphoryl diester phosphodiesterase (GDPDase)
VSKIDLNRVWDDARAIGAANKDLLGAIAGMFVLLPSVVGGLLVKDPAPAPKDLPAQQVYKQFLDLYADNWPVFLGLGIVVSFGLLTMLVLLLRPERLTVGESLKGALILLPGYIVANLAQGFAFGIGFMLFILPGFYVLARLSLIAPVAAAEQCANPIEQLQRSWTLTRGNGWRIFLMLAILYGTVQLVSLVATTLMGLVGELLLPKDIAALCVSIVSGLVAAGFTAFIALLSAAIYRASTAPVATPWLPGSNG